MIDRFTIRKSLEQFDPSEYERLYVQSTAREETYRAIAKITDEYSQGKLTLDEVYFQLSLQRMELAHCLAFMDKKEVMRRSGNGNMLSLAHAIYTVCLAPEIDSADLLLEELGKEAFYSAEMEKQFSDEVMLLDKQKKMEGTEND